MLKELSIHVMTLFDINRKYKFVRCEGYVSPVGIYESGYKGEKYYA